MFVILIMLMNLAGEPAMVGKYNKAEYTTEEACQLALPGIVSEIQARMTADNVPVRIANAVCASADEFQKLKEKGEPRA